MAHPCSPRLSFAPLLAASGCNAAVSPANYTRFGRGSGTYDRLMADGQDIYVPSPLTTFAELLAIGLRGVYRWKAAGIPIGAAEDAAFELGLHPVNVWGDEWLFAAGCPLAKVVAAL